MGGFWATDSFVFIAPGSPGAALDRLVRVDVRDSSFRTYDLAELGIDADYDFDPQTGTIVGSDCIATVDAIDWEDWASERPVVTLWLYDLGTATRKTVATSIAAPFRPRWIGVGVFEFTDPQSGKRVTRRVEALRGGGR